MIKLFKKISLSVIIVTLLIGVFTSPALANRYYDQAKTVQEEVQRAIKEGYVPERIQGDYTKPITREEFVELFIEMVFHWIQNDESSYEDMKITKQDLLDSVVKTDYNFKDTTNENVKIAYLLGVTSGINNTEFAPDRNLTRGEIAVLIANFFQTYRIAPYTAFDTFYSDIANQPRYIKDAINWVLGNDVIKGTKAYVVNDSWKVLSKGNFSPNANITREQAITIVNRLNKGTGYMHVSLRGLIPFTKYETVFEFEVNRNEVKAIKAKVAGTEHEANMGNLSVYQFTATGKKYAEQFPNIRGERTYVIDPAGKTFTKGAFTTEVFHHVNAGKNSTFDLGWATYEVLNPNYLFSLKFKSDVFMTDWVTYSGSLGKQAICKLIK